MQTKFFLNKKLIKQIKNQLLSNNFNVAYIDNIHDEFYQKNISAPTLLEIGIFHNDNLIELQINTRNLTYYINNIKQTQITYQSNLRQYIPNIISQLFNNYIKQQ